MIGCHTLSKSEVARANHYDRIGDGTQYKTYLPYLKLLTINWKERLVGQIVETLVARNFTIYFCSSKNNTLSELSIRLPFFKHLNII